MKYIKTYESHDRKYMDRPWINGLKDILFGLSDEGFMFDIITTDSSPSNRSKFRISIWKTNRSGFRNKDIKNEINHLVSHVSEYDIQLVGGEFKTQRGWHRFGGSNINGVFDYQTTSFELVLRFDKKDSSIKTNESQEADNYILEINDILSGLEDEGFVFTAGFKRQNYKNLNVSIHRKDRREFKIENVKNEINHLVSHMNGENDTKLTLVEFRDYRNDWYSCLGERIFNYSDASIRELILRFGYKGLFNT